MEVIEPVVSPAAFVPSIEVLGSPRVYYGVIFVGRLRRPLQADGAPSLLGHFLFDRRKVVEYTWEIAMLHVRK